MKWHLLFLTVAFLLSKPAVSQDLQSLIEEVHNKEAFWAVTVLDENGTPIERLNSEKLIIPASNQKLFTLGAVLDRLGSNYRFKTDIYGSGNLVDSVWYGDLIIKGVGDPSISGFLYDGDREHVFKSFLRQLKSEGIHKVSGKLIADIGFFDTKKFPPGWDWYDMSFYYGVEIAPLSYNNNAVDLIVEAKGAIGEKPEISWFPYNTDYVEFINDQRITDTSQKYDEDYRKQLGVNEIFLGSTLPKGYIEKESLAITNAALFFVDSFDHFLNINGIQTSEMFEVQRVDYRESYTVLASHSSRALSDLVIWANKESDNFYTEMLLKTMAAEESGNQGTFESGIKEVKEFLAEQKLDTNKVLMNDGSGLATGNFTTTGNISQFLYSMKSHKETITFYKSLPVAGIDGSIAHRFKGTELYNNVRAKTGYVSGVRTLSGYLTTSSGVRITFSIATNHFSGKVRPVDNDHQKILEYLYKKY